MHTILRWFPDHNVEADRYGAGTVADSLHSDLYSANQKNDTEPSICFWNIKVLLVAHFLQENHIDSNNGTCPSTSHIFLNGDQEIKHMSLERPLSFKVLYSCALKFQLSLLIEIL